MKRVTIAALILSLIVLAAGAALLFMIFSPSVQVEPTLAVTASVEGNLLLSICVALLAVAVLRGKHQE